MHACNVPAAYPVMELFVCRKNVSVNDNVKRMNNVKE
jgi:hypothetical protein